MIVSAQSQKKAGRSYIKAFRLKAKKRPAKAYIKMERAIRKNPGAPDAYSQLGQWYFEDHEFARAADVFKMASLKCANGNMRFAKPLAKTYLYAGMPDNALQLINVYSNTKDSSEWNKMRAQAYFIKTAMAWPLTHSPVNMGCRVNTSDPELFPSMAIDTQALYFTRRVNDMDDDLFRAEYDTCGGWFDGIDMDQPPNSPDQENSQFISADGHYMFFTRCENRAEDGWGEGGCDLFMAYRVGNDSDWTIAEPFGSTINTGNFEGMPSLSPDNRELFFVSDRPGGYGGYDIWISRFEDGLWQLPVNAGPNINTAGNETAPYINADNETLYFTSDGWPGMGGNDLFMSKRLNDSMWERPVNMGFPINTAYDEKSECVHINGKKLYFASDRNGPAGNYDLYETELPGNLKPVPVSYLKGYVYDSLTLARLNYAAIFVRDAQTGQTLYQMHSNRGDGSYMIALHMDRTYAIHTERMGFTEVNDTILFDKQYASTPLVHNIVMLPSNYLKPINDTLLATLHFDVNMVALSQADKNVIRDALAPWLDEKAVVIMVNAYTDNTGTPMINEGLSYKRAAIVAQEVISLGIPEVNVTSKGWGEAKMIAPNDNEEGQRKNRRVEIILKR